MDTNGLVFIGFIFFEAIKQILYCFLTLHSCNFKTMSFWKHKNKLDLLSPTYYLFLQGRFDFVQSSYIDLVKWVSTNLVPNLVWTTQNYQIQSRICIVRGSSSNSVPWFYLFVFTVSYSIFYSHSKSAME